MKRRRAHVPSHQFLSCNFCHCIFWICLLLFGFLSSQFYRHLSAVFIIALRLTALAIGVTAAREAAAAMALVVTAAAAVAMMSIDLPCFSSVDFLSKIACICHIHQDLVTGLDILSLELSGQRHVTYVNGDF